MKQTGKNSNKIIVNAMPYGFIHRWFAPVFLCGAAVFLCVAVWLIIYSAGRSDFTLTAVSLVLVAGVILFCALAGQTIKVMLITNRWKEDGVELTAHVKQVGETFEARGMSIKRLHLTKIELTFKYNGETKRVQSGDGFDLKFHFAFRNDGYDKYIELNGRQIDILYSPKYDRVMLYKIK